MRVLDLFQETVLSLSSNKTRSTLTVLGIVIGIGSVIAMVSIGQGAAQDIESNIESLGSNLLVVSPGSSQDSGSMVRGGRGTASTLLLSDAEAIEDEVAFAEEVAPLITSRKQTKTTQGSNTNTSITGVTDSYAVVKSIGMEIGSFISQLQVEKTAKVAVIGPSTRDDLYGEGENPIGQKLRVENIELTIIGVTETKGSSGMDNADDVIYVPITTAQQYLTGSEAVSNIYIQVISDDKMTVAENQVFDLLLTRHEIDTADDADFSIMNQTEIVDTMTEITDTMTLLLGAIAGISLLVGGIGIMNMMLTTVTERTREIGLRKSLGAKKRDISMQFLAESIALTFIGGIIGIFIGWLAAYLIDKLSDTSTAITSSSVILASLVSTVIGVIFGYYPARRAAKLNPIDALRYE